MIHLLKYKLFYLSLLYFLTSFPTSAQTPDMSQKDYNNFPYWIEMMQDPSANFFTTVDAFELYWQNREIQKGSGWKPFKRWEAFMRPRVDEFGNKPDPESVIKEFESYLSQQRSGFGSDCEWTELGPMNVPLNGTSQPTGNGRINTIAFHPSNPNKLYVGAPQGGFWMSSDHGSSWTSSTDNMPTLGVSDILVNYNNPQMIYLGTGDRDHGDAPGLGVYRSTDGGFTFSSRNSGMGNRTVGKMIMHPSNSSIILAATSSGIYRTTNEGLTWSLVSSFGNFKDIVFKPGDPNIVYATANGRFYRSSNNGLSWLLVTSGIPDAYRMAIAVCPSDPAVVYVLATNSATYKALYKSTDSGINFSTQSTTPNIMDYSSNGSGNSGQAWYCMDIAVDPLNSATVYVGGINVFKSVNSGVSWTINAHWVGSGAPAVHADHHSLEFTSLNNRLYACHDGGLHYTTNGGSSWTDITGNLAIAQVYRIGQSATLKDFVINGYQDNGTAIFDSGTFRTEIGGDGMECIVDHSDAAYSYGALYYGDIRRSSNFGLSYSRIAANGSNGINESGAWITPYCISEQNPNTMFVGYDNVWRSTNIKTAFSSSVNWTKISNNLGGSSANLDRIEASPANSDLLFISRSNTLFRTTDVLAPSPGWTELTGGLPSAQFINDIECHPDDPNIVYMLQGSEVYKSTNMGNSWTLISGTLPNISMNTMVYEPGSDEALYVGADAGIYFKDASMSDWELYAVGFPVNAEVTELEIYKDAGNSSNDRIRACTFGRGLWEAPLAGKPVGQFSETALSGCVPLSIVFSDESSRCPGDWQWQLTGPEQANATTQDLEYSFTIPGTYAIQLIVGNDFGADTIVKNFTLGGTPEVSASLMDETCENSLDGSIDLTVQQHNPPYTFSWTGGATTEDISGLGTGIYTVLVTDQSGCTMSESYSIVDDAQLLITSSKRNVTCYSSSNGTATVSASGNRAPFSYTWNTVPVQTTATITGLAGGTYDVTAMDSSGCVKSTVVEIFEPTDLTVFMFPNFPSQGQIQVLVSGGVAPYTYDWSNGETTQIISNASPGFYFCQVKDFNSCAKLPSVVLSSPQLIPWSSEDNLSRMADGQESALTVFPNPVSGFLNWTLNGEFKGIGILKIHDASGKILYQREIEGSNDVSDSNVNISHFSSGEYFLSLRFPHQQFHKTFIKK